MPCRACSFVLALQCVMALAGPVLAQGDAGISRTAKPETRPDARAVLDAYVVALGGTEAIEAVDGVLRISSWSIGESSGTSRAACLPGGVFKTVLAVDGSSWQELRGSDGTVAWVKDNIDTCNVLADADGLVQRMVNDPRWPVDHERYIKRMQVTGSIEVGGRPAWKVVMTPLTGRAMTAFFDKDTGLLVRLETSQTGQGGTPWVVETTWADWETVNGVKWPRSMRRTSPAGQLVYVTQTEPRELAASIGELPECVRLSMKTTKPAGQAGHAKLRQIIGAELVDKDGNVVSTDVLADKPDVLLYFSALWCPPCKIFTPSLVKVYEEHADEHPFTVVLVSSDRSAAKMSEYMTKAGMNWYAIPWDRVTPSGIKTLYGSGRIPNLIWLDEFDRRVSSTYDGSRNLGPDKVLGEFREYLGVE